MDLFDMALMLTGDYWSAQEAFRMGEIQMIASPGAILAVSWVHGDHLFCVFKAYGWGMPELIEDFSLTPSRMNTVFHDWNPLDHDVANPHNVTPEALLICGLQRATIQGDDFCIYPGLRDRLRSLVLLTAEGLSLPKVDLIPDVVKAPNQLRSFLSCDRLAAFRSLGQDADPGAATLREKLQLDALSLLKHDHSDGWLTLKAAFGNEPIPVAHRVSPAGLSHKTNRRSAARKPAVSILVLSEIRLPRCDANVGREHEFMRQVPGVAVRNNDHRLREMRSGLAERIDRAWIRWRGRPALAKRSAVVPERRDARESNAVTGGNLDKVLQVFWWGGFIDFFGGSGWLSRRGDCGGSQGSHLIQRLGLGLDAEPPECLRRLAAWRQESQIDGYGYSRFCELYGRWGRNQDVMLRDRTGLGRTRFANLP